MNNWMQVKVRYTKQMEDGGLKRVTEPYLLAAHSFTDAEARIYEELGETIRGEFEVTAIAKYEVHDIFGYDDADVWYKAKCQFETIDSDSDKASKAKQTFLVSASSVKEATERIIESLKDLHDLEIKSVIETPLVEIFPLVEG
jgi:hypothetical protein